jgi:hypothetical protein
MGRSAARPQRFPGMDGAEAEDRPATMSLRLVGPAALSDYRIGDSGYPTGRDRQAVPGLDARRGCGAAAQAQSRPRRGCGPAKARGATYPRGAVVPYYAVWEPFNGRAPIFLPEFNSDHDDHGELTARADGSNAAAIPYVTPANDDVPTSLRLRAHC